jgi:hypothetical protein
MSQKKKRKHNCHKAGGGTALLNTEMEDTSRQKGRQLEVKEIGDCAQRMLSYWGEAEEQEATIDAWILGKYKDAGI